MPTLEEAIGIFEQLSKLCETNGIHDSQELYKQYAAWLRELQERRKAPEIVRCDECTHYIPILSNWGKCGVHSSPTEKYRTCQSCDYCSWAEKREEENKWVKNPYVQCR